MARPVTCAVVGELGVTSALVCAESSALLTEQLLQADRVFICGMGRSGFAMRGFAMRLSHMGIAAHFVGETTTPPIAASGDLLLVGSGSGRTPSLLSHAEKVQAMGGDSKVALITTDSGSPLGGVAQATGGATLVLPAPTPKAQAVVAVAGSGTVSSVQPMASLFEQTMGLMCDALVLELMERTGQGAEEMFGRHTNLE